MQGFPFNLVLAIAIASMTIFIGFLPTKTIRSSFFGLEALKAAFAWIFVTLAVPQGVMHYYIFFAIVCAGSWWQFRHDLGLRGKMWLSVASGLGISLGGMLILATTPAYLPIGNASVHQELNQMESIDQAVLVASIYLGGAVLGLAYVVYILTRQVSTSSGVTNTVVQRYADLLLILVLVRAAMVVVSYFVLGEMSPGVRTLGSIDFHSHVFGETVLAFILLLLVMPALAVYVKWGSRMASRIQPTRALVAMIFLGFGAEVLARLLVF